MVHSAEYLKGIVGPAGSDSKKRKATGTLLNEALYDAKQEADAKFAKAYPASDFARAWHEKPIEEEERKPTPLHASLRERKKERAEQIKAEQQSTGGTSGGSTGVTF